MKDEISEYNAVHLVQELDTVAVYLKGTTLMSKMAHFFLCPVSGAHVREQVATLH